MGIFPSRTATTVTATMTMRKVNGNVGADMHVLASTRRLETLGESNECEAKSAGKKTERRSKSC